MTGPARGRAGARGDGAGRGAAVPGRGSRTRTCDVLPPRGRGPASGPLRSSPEGVQIRVDRVREALAFAAGRPYEAPRRVAIVARAELLGAEAGNALLKSLEEPGAHIHWILTTTRPESLLPTIRSRCAVARISAAARRRAHRPLARARILRGGRPGPAAPGARARGGGARGSRGLPAVADGDPRGARGRACAAERSAALVFLAEALAREEPAAAHRLAELLADAAAVEAGVDPLRHRSVAGSSAAHRAGRAARRSGPRGAQVGRRRRPTAAAATGDFTSSRSCSSSSSRRPSGRA